MSLVRAIKGCAAVAVGMTLLQSGCTSHGGRQVAQTAVAPAESKAPGVASSRRPSATNSDKSVIAPAAFQEPDSSARNYLEAPIPALDADDPFAGRQELILDELVAAVQSRNPTLQASLAAWSSAAERYPQVVALDDPTLQSMVAPGSLPSASNVQSSYYVGIAQKIPWYGKRALRGEVARAEANAASFDSQEVQLRLGEAARLAYFDYYLVYRELEINSETTDDFQRFRETANEKYVSNLVTQQDVLQAEVELAKLESRRIELEKNEHIAVARINTLLHRVPDQTLPPPPATLDVTDSLPRVEFLRQFALEQRPELAAKASRIQAEQASVELACKEYYPDFEFMGRYDQFWTDVEQRPQVGMNVNIPLNQARRKASVREAMYRLSRMQAEYEQEVDNIRHDVQTAFARLDASRKNVHLYASKILPAAESNIASANAGYVAGTVDFLRLIEAQRELLDLREKHQQAIAEFYRRRAELERVLGSPLPMVTTNGDVDGTADSLLVPVTID